MHVTLSEILKCIVITLGCGEMVESMRIGKMDSSNHRFMSEKMFKNKDQRWEDRDSCVRAVMTGQCCSVRLERL